jgi:hypothetical protein
MSQINEYSDLGRGVEPIPESLIQGFKLFEYIYTWDEISLILVHLGLIFLDLQA